MKTFRFATTKSLVTAILAFVILIPSLWGFAGKFAELMTLVRGESDGAFAISPVVNYLLASLGFFCLLCWAAFNGMFRDIERPKEAMLEIERRLDEQARRPVTVHSPGRPPCWKRGNNERAKNPRYAGEGVFRKVQGPRVGSRED